jgi:drug/metabolite transporter (DMT)-like permease
MLGEGEVMQALGAILLILAYFGYSLTNLLVYLYTAGTIPVVLYLGMVNFTQAAILFLRAFFLKKKIQRPRKARLIFFRALTGSIFSLSYFAALSYSSFAEVGILTNSFPLFIVLIAWLFLGEKVSFWQWVALFIGITGVWFILSPNILNFFNGGMLFATMASVFWAISLIIMQKIADYEEVYSYLLYFYSFSLLLLIPFIIYYMEPVSLAQVGLALIAGVINLASQGLMFRAYKICSAAELAPYNFSFAFFHFILAKGLFSFVPTRHFFIGALLIFLGGVINLVIFEKSSRPAAAPKIDLDE